MLSEEISLKLMKLALNEAKKAYKKQEVPIGAVIAEILPNNSINVISKAYNLVEKNCSALAHAEILSIQKASKKTKNWRLNNLVLAVTLEPCIMCWGGILQSRISTVIYGAKEPRFGALGSRCNLKEIGEVEIVSGVLEEESRNLIQKFFKERRG